MNGKCIVSNILILLFYVSKVHKLVAMNYLRKSKTDLLQIDIIVLIPFIRKYHFLRALNVNYLG